MIPTSTNTSSSLTRRAWPSIFRDMVKALYDKKSEILSLRLSNKKSVDSDVRGNVVIDYDKNGDVVGVEIMGISFGEFSRVDSQVNRLPKIKYESVA